MKLTAKMKRGRILLIMASVFIVFGNLVKNWNSVTALRKETVPGDKNETSKTLSEQTTLTTDSILREEDEEPQWRIDSNLTCENIPSAFMEERRKTNDWDIKNIVRPDKGGFKNATRLENATKAVCAFRFRRHYSHHFPHAMEGIYRCWTFWKTYPDKKPVLFYQDGHGHFPPGNTTREEKIEFLSKEPVLFYEGMLLSLIEVFDIELTTQIPHDAPMFRPAYTKFTKGPGFQLRKPNDLHEFMDAVVPHYGINKGKQRAGCQGKSARPRIAILNRNYGDPKNKKKRGSRSILNSEATSMAIEQEILKGTNAAPVVYFENATFQEQLAFFDNVDILVSPHGAQLTGVGFMPRCGGLVELFPPFYYYPHYFGQLAVDSGLSYMSIYVARYNKTDDPNRLKFNQAVKRHLCPQIDPVLQAIRNLEAKWHTCCSQHQLE